MFLAGSFSEYPFLELLEILLHKRETGLLDVSSSQQCGHFYIKNGVIKDGEVGKLRGAEAIELAGTFEDGSFQFKRLDSTEYAQLVWQESFGLRNVTAENPSFSALTSLKQVPSFPIAAYTVLENAVLWVARRALPQLLNYLGSAYRSLAKAAGLIAHRTFSSARTKCLDLLRWVHSGRTLVPTLRPVLSERQAALSRYLDIALKQARVLNLQFRRGLVLIRKGSVVLQSLSTAACSRAVQKQRSYGITARRNLGTARILIAGRTRVYAKTVWQSLKTVQVKRILLPAFRRAQPTWQIALRRTKQIVLKTARILNFQNARALIQERRAQTNISFALIVVVLLVGTTVSITKILKNNDQPNSVVSTKEENVDAQPEAPRKVARRRVKRTRRTVKPTPNKMRKVKDTETAVVK